MERFAERYGFHPLAAMVMISADVLLVGSETVATLFGIETAGVSLAVAILINAGILIVLSTGCILLQRYSYRDDWLKAIVKGIIVGIVTAIPTPFAAIITFGSGVAGTASMFQRRRGKKIRAPSKKRARPKKRK